MSQLVKKDKIPDVKFDVKEVGYLLKCLEDGHHSGNALELALACKLKLQNVLEKLINNKEVL